VLNDYCYKLGEKNGVVSLAQKNDSYHKTSYLGISPFLDD
jgi:hypothetical protein